MNLTTEYQFEVTFPVICLFILDAIFPRRVNWGQIDLRYQYKKALQQNYKVLRRIWAEVLMEKAREFRVEYTHLRLENMPASGQKDKLEFIKLMQRWYQQRFHNADPYEPLSRRRAIAATCLSSGHKVQYPPWILHDKEEPSKKPEQILRDTFRVCAKGPINVLADKSGTSEVIGSKNCMDSFVGHVEGDWIMLLDEPGWIFRMIYETREKLVEKQEKYRVVSKQPVAVMQLPSQNAQKIGTKKFGDMVFGYPDGDWVELTDEKGYSGPPRFMDMFPPGGSRAHRVLQNSTKEDYNSMPEFKRLIWFLGSPEHLTM
mmetsp:Transcript_59454/g.192243  ORF Transcript_59454/g.192243 Transcript_59454/m.192243 type:complete len:316 (-) Transcript_59454:77-1024(-)